MAKSTNLGLELTNDNIPFEEWYKTVNGDNDGDTIELSNMQIIDKTISEIKESLGV